MRDAENESHEGKRKAESLWPIMRISHARSRYIYELYYKREAISKELYEWLLKQGYADAKSVHCRCSLSGFDRDLITLFFLSSCLGCDIWEQLDCEVEEDRLREALLPPLYPD